jgi:hypothetical protein
MMQAKLVSGTSAAGGVAVGGVALWPSTTLGILSLIVAICASLAAAFAVYRFLPKRRRAE